MTNNAQLIPSLNALRGVAALLVIFYHYNLFICEIITKEITHIPSKFYLMVDLFFVLSGFIMCHVYSNLFQSGVNRKNFKQFMVARFARIYPLHFSTLFFLIVLALFAGATNSFTTFTHDMFDFEAIPEQLLLIQASWRYLLPTWNASSWSISVEWWVYPLFPFITFFFANTKSWSKWLTFGLVLAGYLLLLFYLQPIHFKKIWLMLSIPANIPMPKYILDLVGGWAILRCLCAFVLGMLVFELYSKKFAINFFSHDFTFLICWILLFTLWHFQLLFDLFAMAVIATIILSAATNETQIKKTLSNRFWQFTGNISYSLYLVHLPIAFLFFTARVLVLPDDPALKAPFGYNFPLHEGILGLIAFFIVCIATATFTYYKIEKPARDYINSKFKK